MYFIDSLPTQNKTAGKLGKICQIWAIYAIKCFEHPKTLPLSREEEREREKTDSNSGLHLFLWWKGTISFSQLTHNFHI